MNQINSQKIGFIGAGNMARSIIGGLIAQGLPAKNILACDPFEQNRDSIKQEFAINVAEDNTAVSTQNVIVLAVKPQIMKTVCEGLSSIVTADTLIISIAAGITCKSLKTWLKQDLAIIRCMPNTPALVQEGASALYPSPEVNADQKEVAEAILAAVGTVDWVTNEALIDTVTALSGSGPAYFFLMFEAMIESAVKQGLSHDIARTLAVQTALGSAKLAKNCTENIEELRRRVTSPGGTTERAIQSFEDNGLRNVVDDAMQAAASRSRELAELMDN